MVSNSGKEFEIVRRVLTKYLEENGQRKTSERYAILEEIYAYDEHLDVDTLHFKMRLNNYRVSKATIYNNLDLLIEAGLVRKHQFGKGTAHYEKCFFHGQHDHVILTDTEELMEFCDPRIATIKKRLRKPLMLPLNPTHSIFMGRKKRKPILSRK